MEYYDYDAYGSPTLYDVSDTVISSSTVDNPYYFTGREYDNDTGLYYYRARYYDPEIGRFLQNDPIGYFGGINLYGYVRNNPWNWVDPWGLEAEKNGFNWRTFRYGIAEVTLGLMGIIGGASFILATNSLGSFAGVAVFNEGIFSTAIGVADIIGSFIGNQPIVSQVTRPASSLIYPFLPDFSDFVSDSKSNTNDGPVGTVTIGPLEFIGDQDD